MLNANQIRDLSPDAAFVEGIKHERERVLAVLSQQADLASATAAIRSGKDSRGKRHQSEPESVEGRWLMVQGGQVTARDA